MRADNVSSSSSGRTGTTPCAMIGPVSVSGRTKCTVQPANRTPAASAWRWACRPRKAGNSDGWILTMRSRHASTKTTARIRIKPARHTRSTPAPRRAASAAAANSRRSPSGMTVLASFAAVARARPGASPRLLTTSAISAGKPGSALASPAKLRYDGSIVHCRTMPVRRRFAMLLPLVSVIAASRTGRVIAGVAWVLVVAAFVVTPVLADDQPDPYTATVKVDATADSAAAARTIARTDGQRRALMEVLERVSGSADLSKLPKLDDQTITDMVDSFEVANEKMSTVRYLADYTFHFHPAKVRRLLRSANIAIAEAPAKPVVVVPVYRNAGTLTLWDDPNPWREAWN